MDIIDIANLAFDRLVEQYKENPNERLNFLFFAKQGQPWPMSGYSKVNRIPFVKVTANGITSGFPDVVFNKINAEVKAIRKKEKEEAARTAQTKADAERRSQVNKFKNGDVYNFWDNQEGSTNINLKL